MPPITINKIINPLSLQQHFETVARAATSKREKVVATPSPTPKAFAREAYDLLFNFDFSSKKPIVKQALDELKRNVTGLLSLASHVLLHPVTAVRELQILNGNFQVLEELLLKRVPLDSVGYTHLGGSSRPIIPFNQFNPDTHHCLSSGDSRLGMLLKEKDKDNNYKGNPFIVEHKGSKGNLHWVAKKEGSYDVMQELFGRLGPVGAPDFPQHEVSRKLVRYEDYFFDEAVKNKRPQNVQIILENAFNIEQLLKSGKKFNLREEWEKSIKETLFKSIVGDISPDEMNFIVNNIDIGFRHLSNTRALGPIPGITIFSETNQAGEKAIRNLHLLGLDMMNDRIKRLQQNGKPQDLLDAFALGAVRLISEIPDNDPQKAKKAEEITFEASKIFFEMIGAGYFNRSNSRSNFDYIALTDPDFREGLVKALDPFEVDMSKPGALKEIFDKALKNETLLKPFYAAAYAALAYQPSVLFISRNSRVVFRKTDEKGNPDQKEEAVELTDRELRQLTKKHNINHPLLEIPQNTESILPLGAYGREGLKRNDLGLLLEDGGLNSKEIFNPDKFDAITKVGKWAFGAGIRRCVGLEFSRDTLVFEALCMAYYFKKFPMKIVGEVEEDFNIFSGKRFMVRA